MKASCISIPLALVLLLAACGGTGTTPTPPVTTPPTTPAPTITSFAATPSTISPGQSSTLSWTVSGTATSLTLTPGIGDMTGATSYSVSPSATTTYTLTATGEGGTVTSTATVTVQGGTAPPADGAPVINSFTASPTSVSAGQPVTLSWSVTNSEIIRLTPDPGQGDLSNLTSVTVTPMATTTYTLEAVSLNGLDDTASVTVTVSGSSQPPVSDVPYYGEWIVTYTSDTGVSFIHSLNITEAAPAGGWENGGYGLQTLCLDEATPCRGAADDLASGYGYIGNFTLSDGTAPLDMTLFTQYEPEDEPELKITTSGGLSVGTDAQGRQTLSGSARWALSDDSFDNGAIYAVNIGAPRSLTGLGVFSAGFLSSNAWQLRNSLQRILE